MKKNVAKKNRKTKDATSGATDRERNAYLKRKYNITVEQYEWLLAEQEGACFICRREPKNRRLHVDHCHKTDRVRGLLCWRCNSGIAKFRDNAEAMLRAGHYLGRDYDGRHVC